ncbi:glycosyltransferase [Streptomyces sp. NPDC018031]|uniref:glycosyltransferase family 2 protein n=1 Tax=Streptomyces sp. NPDC018031 TaxID=3365033 RepID=UPI0037B76E44
MSVHNQPAARYPADAAAVPERTPEFPRHVVTAVLVAHDGARWLPDALAGLVGQERPVQNIVAADTGSADDSAQLLADALGPERVLHLARRAGFGTAVDEAVRTAPVLGPDQLPYLKRPSAWDPATRTWRDDAYDQPELPHGEPVQWLWLLHDDCAPAPDALAELLRVADGSPHTAIVGPKLRSWYDRRQLLEVGVSIARSGRRWTGLERREQDQGQHDQVRPVLAVSTAGMLVRRDVYEALGGFDPRLPLMRDDIDLCWRAQAAGHQVLVAPDAVLRHAEASARERRPIDCVGRSASRPAADGSAAKRFASHGTSPHRVDKAGAVYTLLVNTRGALLPYVLLRLVLSTLLRTVAYLVGKVPRQALDELAGLFGTLLRPEKILAARRQRGKSLIDAAELRPLFPPPGATVRATVEQIAGNIGGRSEPELSAGGRHGAVESGPGDDDADFLQIEQFARLKRIARKPGPMLFAVLLLVSFIACRDLIGGGSLAGGALLPTPSDLWDLWARYTDGWHPVGTGGTEPAPPYLAVFAGLSTVLLGSTGFTLTLLLVCSVPLAGITAYFASRPLVESRLLRAWGSVAYAFLPAATGALAGGRIGTAALAVLLPLMARAAVAAGGFTGSAAQARPSWRAAWAYALLLTFTMAFTPVVWPLALALGLGVLAFHFSRTRTAHLAAHGLRLLAVLATPLLILAPWSLPLLVHPGRFLDEAGLSDGYGAASALDLLALSPGGPKGGGSLLLLGFVLAALGALLRGERQLAVRTAWVVALTGLLFAAVSNRSGWAGPATLVYGLALLSAAVVGAEGARERVAAQSFGWRQPAALLVAAASAAAPLLAALSWMAGGADGPVERRDPVQVPAFVAAEAGNRDQARTLVLDGDRTEVDYVLVRGAGARLGDAELAVQAGSDPRLDKVVANLVAGSGADHTRQLSGYAVRYVLVRPGAPRQLVKVLETTPGLTRLSQEDGTTLLRLDQRVSRVSVVPGPAGDRSAAGAGDRDAPVPVASGPVESHTEIPDGPAGRVLRIADKAAPGWQATLDGKPLKSTEVDGWAQGFELPAGGGRLDLTYETPLARTAWVWAQGLLAVVLLVLALPGRRRDVDDDLPETEVAAAAAAAAAAMEGDGRRARRLRAAAEAAGQADQAGRAPAAPGAPAPGIPGPRSGAAPAGLRTGAGAGAAPGSGTAPGTGTPGAPGGAADLTGSAAPGGFPAPGTGAGIPGDPTGGAVPAPPVTAPRTPSGGPAVPPVPPAPPAAPAPYAAGPAGAGHATGPDAGGAPAGGPHQAPDGSGQPYGDWQAQPYPPAGHGGYPGGPYQAATPPADGGYAADGGPGAQQQSPVGHDGGPYAPGPYGNGGGSADGGYGTGGYGTDGYAGSGYAGGYGYGDGGYGDGGYGGDAYPAAGYPVEQPYQQAAPYPAAGGYPPHHPDGGHPAPGDTPYDGGDGEPHRDGSDQQR